MKAISMLFAGLLTVSVFAQTGLGKPTWRYYRPGNTGIQGDYCDALWISPNGDPWIGGYDPSFEEGGLAKLIRSENRWVNISNVDYPEIGHPEQTGITRVRDIEKDAQGNLWMGTGRGVLKFNPSIGPRSLKRYDANNSVLPGGWMTNVEVTPDGMVWASGYATVWGGGGLSRFNPSSSTWTFLGTSRGEVIASQPRPGGGYYLWAGDRQGTTGLTSRYDSTTQAWTTYQSTVGQPKNLPGAHCVDTAGNLWIYRVLADGFNVQLDCRRPDGTWVGVPPPPVSSIEAIRAKGPLQALVASGGQVWKFDGSSWSNLGNWRAGHYDMDVDSDSSGNVWACGTGGAAVRNVSTGAWQRYRITNTSQFDNFTNDLALDSSGGFYATANAGTGYGGMVHYDGQRFIGFNQATYGLGFDWPFPTDSSQSVTVRANGNAVVNPMYNGLYEWNGSSWTNMNAGRSTLVSVVEDSLGRLWSLGEYYYLACKTGNTWTEVPIISWGGKVVRDPDRAGTVWAQTLHEVKRTDTVYNFSRTIDNFPELTAQSDVFTGLAAGHNGVAWVGCTVMLGAGGTGGGLIRLDSQSGQYRLYSYESGWPLPGKYVFPLATSPDGRVWMVYTNTWQYFDGGLCWFDGTRVGVFPGPVDGAMQWGGLPHTQIADMEVRSVPGGYELWMSCKSRGVAVLKVQSPIGALPKP
ncbi:MAG: hypothetical protein JNM34_02590 [Chthonomonadaceae bacterium]|nr:hypothetical protein [Chthonomonadaceae bacterium]